MDSAMDILAQTEADMKSDAQVEAPEGDEKNEQTEIKEEAEGEDGTSAPKKSSVDPPIPTPKRFRLFVGQIPKGTTMEEFTEFCKTIGADADFLKEGSERPFGFVNVDDEETRDKLLSDSIEFKETALTITLAKSKTVKFFLGGVTKETSEQMITDHFAKYGKVQEAFVVKNRGFGFVVIESQQIKVLDAIPNSAHEIDGRSIDVKVAQPKGGNRRFGGRGGYHGGPPAGYYGGYAPYGGYGYGGYGGYG